MATNKNVIVLVPNGRRQNVGVTPNTTILQVLEKVCQKHGYNIDEYDLKHFNRVLDPNAILRFTGLANNAQLEMIPCKKIRSTSTVIICIQLENGQRLMGEFVPNTTLVEVLQKVNFPEDINESTLIYMHREISGAEGFKNTTLKSLGLNNGRAVLRVIRKNPENVHTTTSTTSKVLKDNKTPHKKSTIYSNETSHSKELEVCSQNTRENTKLGKNVEVLNNMTPSSSNKDYDTNQIVSQQCDKHETSDSNAINFIGDRNALIFNQAQIEGSSKDELPDDFYDLTVNDAKILLRDAKRHKDELEDAPLLTNVQRQQNYEKEKLNQLEKYHFTIIRIYFADQFVLQGLFKPTETVQAIKDFVKSYLIDANGDFAIYIVNSPPFFFFVVIVTSPPKHILDPNAHLINENLVPCAIVYYSGPSALKSDIKQKSADPKDVEKQVTKDRISMMREDNREMSENMKINITSCKGIHSNDSSNKSLDEKKNMVPKWFKRIV